MHQLVLVLAMDIPQSESIYQLKEEDLKFLKIFQSLGFLPFKLTTNEGNLARNAGIGLFIFLVSLVLLRCFLLSSEQRFIVLFFLDIITLLTDQIYTQFMRKTQMKLFTMIGEIDQKIEKELLMKHILQTVNLSLHRKFKIKWIIYTAASLYYPVKQLVLNDLSMEFFDALFRIFSW